MEAGFGPEIEPPDADLRDGDARLDSDKIVEQVPGDVSELKVVCFSNGLNIAVMGTSWQDAKAYLQTEINGYQFGSRVYRSTIP